MQRLRRCFVLLPFVILALSWAPVMAQSDSGTTSTTHLQPRIPDSDYGDAPDPTYPTLSASNGAYHSIVSGLTLGVTVDPEMDGQPDPTATGDDNTGTNDEDGVIFNGPLVPGQQTLMTITVSMPCAISAWADFNGDGDWLDAMETLFAGIPLTAGAHQINLGVPATAVPGPTFLRFRVTTTGALPFTGGAPDGEVEDYMATIEEPPALDFGDAPDPSFPTLLANNGARHVIDGMTSMGVLPDQEPDGQPNPTATGDDVTSGDEDGVLFLTPLIPGFTALVDVNASVPGMLDAWIDFDNNGSWTGTGEQVFASFPLAPGINNLGFIVPPGTASTGVFARFRFSTNGGLSFDGLAPDGEVEDYQVFIEEPLYDWGDAPDPFYPTLSINNGAVHTIDETIFLGYSPPDGELDGQPQTEAQGDDSTGFDDEDGVVHSPGTIVSNSTTVVVVSASTSGFLNAWVDFNSDGDWTDAGEQVFNDVPVVAGANHLAFTAPASVLTPTCARYRFDTTGGLTDVGPASDGEVEDYYFETPIFVDGFESGNTSMWSSDTGL